MALDAKLTGDHLEPSQKNRWSMNTTHAEALRLLLLGWSIIPIGQNKRPLINWKEFQERLPSAEEIKNWFDHWPNASIAVVTGKISNLIVLDIDAKHNRSAKEFQIPATACSKTGGGGEHIFFLYPGKPVANSNGSLFGTGVDIKGDAGYAILPPSQHSSGNQYKWQELCSPYDIELAQVPKWLSDKIFSEDINKEKLWQKEPSKINEGTRNETATSVAGKILHSLPVELRESIGWTGLLSWNQSISKPLPEKELRSVWESIKRYKPQKDQSTLFTKPHLWSVGEILNSDFGEEEWLVKFLISRQGITALSGNPGDFKTWITIHIAICISRNLQVFGRFDTDLSGSVLIIDEEDHIRLLQKRLKLLGAENTDLIHYISQGGIKVDADEPLSEIIEIVRSKNIKLVILDSLVRIHQQDENDAGGMSKVFESMKKIIAEGASILFTHHHRKQFGFGSNNLGQSMRGSSDILAAVDSHITIKKKPESDEILIIEQTKLRQAELLVPFEIKVVKGENGPSGFEYIGDYDERKAKADEASSAIVILLSEGMKSRPDIHDSLREEYGKSVIDMAIKLTQESGRIERVSKENLPKGERKAFYKLAGELPVSQLYIDSGKQEVEENAFGEL